jgi:ATP-dependent exoDNAse (exonuclease V) alpha subunit
MLSRSLLYTAVTRAKARVTIVGDLDGLKRAVKTNAAARCTSLAERLTGTLEHPDQPAGGGEAELPE